MTSLTHAHPTPKAAGTRRHVRAWPRRARRGLLNVLLTVGITALAIVAIISLYNQITTNTRNLRLTTLVQSLASETQNAFSTSPDYGTDGADLVPILMARNAVPSSSRAGTGAAATIRNPYDRGADITVATSNGGDSFTISVPNLPVSACTTLLEAYIGLNANDGAITAATVGGGGALELPLDQGKVVGACAAGATQAVALVF